MNKLIVIFVLLNVLSIYYQLESSSFSDSSFGGNNSKYTLKCHKFASICQEIEVDDGWEINTSDNCVESGANLPDVEICFDYNTSNKCRRIKDQSISYVDNTCGSHAGIEGLKQCTKLSDFTYSIIDTDNHRNVR